MSRRIVIQRTAQNEFDKAADWFEQEAERGLAFTAAVHRVLTEITGQPDRYPEVHDYEHLREAPVRGYPYTIYYHFDDDRVTVVAIYHNSRDPAGWQRRA